MNIQNKSNENSQYYTKLLNNSLNIKGKDQTLFTKVNGVDSFDMTSKFSKSISEKIISQNKFTLILKESDIIKLIDEVKTTNDPDKIIFLFEKYKEKLFNTKKMLLKNEESFSRTKKELLDLLKIKHQKEKIRWKQYRRKIIDANTQNNIWPLHLATFFISISTSKKNIYAPLLLKEVEINIEKNDDVKLKSIDNWKINEKLIFMLSEDGIKLDIEENNEEDNFSELVKKICSKLNYHNMNISFTDEFKNYKSDDVVNKYIKFHSGVVLGLFNPSGGNLRKVLQEIIKNDEIDEILDSEVDKSIYKNRVDNFILEKSDKLIKIQKSSYAQDKALISSLIQDTIIIGPPGTGKSQVIANIIANIFFYNKKAIVMSQKKAALDVLKKRLASIAPFALFILNDNKMDKKEFYKPLIEFVNKIENSLHVDKLKFQKMISPEDVKKINIICDTNKNNTFHASLNIIEKFHQNEEILKKIVMLSTDYKYPLYCSTFKKYKHMFMELNKIKYKKFLWIKFIPNEIRILSKLSYEILCFYNGKIDINEFIVDYKNTNKKDIFNLLKVAKNKFNIPKEEISDNYLADYLSYRILSKIKKWKISDYSKYMEYKKFANAARAERRLPFKFMNDHISIIQSLFPIIITTPETGFINWEKNYFDYAIVDESSQIFLEIGLPILYLSKIKILAGDDKQMQPSRWFSTRDDNVGDEEEEDVAENADSLLNYARDKGIYNIMLDQNYRSYSASLMSFSSKEFYESGLAVVDNSINKEKIAIDVINVDGKWESSVNILEMEKTIEILNDNIDKYSSIIVLTFNSPQRQLIEKTILEKYPNLSKEIEKDKLSIRNIENIQGDEADLVIMSVVYDYSTSIATTYVARPGGQYALNVAVSRAKAKMIVVKSITSENVKLAKSDDYLIFKKWLRFLDLSHENQKKYSKKSGYNIVESYGEVDSKFERNVLNFIKETIITQYKFSIIKQYNVGSFSIDLAILNDKNDFILGIEVDGYKYHNGQGIDKHLSDISRQNYLESKGYNIYRITEIDFRINKQKIKNDLLNLLNNLNTEKICEY